jgi:hypothetical protein
MTTDLTPERVREIRAHWQSKLPPDHALRVDVEDLCNALEKAWAERDEAWRHSKQMQGEVSGMAQTNAYQYDRLRSERDDLRARLAVAEEALDRVAAYDRGGPSEYAKKALAKIREGQ